jgi:hypothetical protein
MRKPQTDTDPRVGDRARLVSETSLRKDEMDLQGQAGEVIECSEGKRVAFASPTAGCSWEGDAKLFERTKRAPAFDNPIRLSIGRELATLR